MKRQFVFLLFSLFLSCGKLENVKKVAPDMIGDWVHYSANNGFHILYIQGNGRGSQWGENDHGNNVDTQSRGWFIKEDVLYFSRWQNGVAEDKFEIDQYPVTAGSDIFLPYDTIYAGQRFMVLNGRHYKER